MSCCWCSGGRGKVVGLSLTQPWATLMAMGIKRIETRSWSSNSRGYVAIHASTRFPTDCRELCEEEPFTAALHGASWRDLPRGAIIAVANLHDVARIKLRRDGVVCVERMAIPPDETELAFGNYEPGRWAWRLTNVRALREPIPCKGALGLWPVPDAVLWQIREQLGGEIK